MKMNRFYLFLLLISIAGTVSAQSKTNKKTVKTEVPERVINADFRNEKGTLNTMFRECVGAGRANEGLRADWQQQLAFVKKECGFKYIRMHGLLTDDMGVYREDKN